MMEKQYYFMDVLLRAREIIATPQTWLKGAMGQMEDGSFIGVNNAIDMDELGGCVRFCLNGAVCKAFYEKFEKSIAEDYAIIKFINKQIQLHTDYLFADGFNEAPETQHKDVIQFLDMMIGKIQ